MSNLAYTLLSEQLAWYRLQRHDFLNQWQVVMGYLQLKQEEKALVYLRGAVQDMEAERKVNQIEYPIVGAIMLGLVLQLRQTGLSVRVDIAESLKTEDFWQAHWQEEYDERLYGYTKSWLEDVKRIINQQAGPSNMQDVMVAISIMADPKGFSCALSVHYGEFAWQGAKFQVRGTMHEVPEIVPFEEC